ncbi:MAG: hypothetical protein KAI17_19500, partial [Thiotrichaceae bacterium]|nr:hypothetical protein [Thiotrichaceae bacterium]
EFGMLGAGDPTQGYLWTAEQLFYTMWALHEMPPAFIKYTKYIRRIPILPSHPTAHAYVIRGQPRVYFCDRGIRPGGYERTLIHEMAHVWMFDSENLAVKNDFMETFWPDNRIVGSAPTGYGYTNVYEDFAECVAEFWQHPLEFKAMCPARFEFILHKVIGYYSTEPRAFSINTDLTGTY